MAQSEEATAIAKSEQRLWNIIIAVTLGVGGWWLQSQATQTVHVADQLVAYTRLVDEKYASSARVERMAIDIDTKADGERVERLAGEVTRLEDKLAKMIEAEIAEHTRADAAGNLK